MNESRAMIDRIRQMTDVTPDELMAALRSSHDQMAAAMRDDGLSDLEQWALMLINAQSVFRSHDALLMADIASPRGVAPPTTMLALSIMLRMLEPAHPS